MKRIQVGCPFRALLAAVLLGTGAGALATTLPPSAPPAPAFDHPAAWSEPQPPFRIVGNIHYVGTRGLAAYLIATPKGLILIDGTLPETAPQILANIAALGFRPGDVRYLLNSHAHFDHAGGLARLKRETGAQMLASRGDRAALVLGRHQGDNVHGVGRFPAVPVDAVFDDGARVRLGGTVLTARLTPGHSPGCTTWAMTTSERGRTLRVVFPCSVSVAGNRLTDNRTYPGIEADYRASFATLRAMRADVVLPAHPELVDVIGRQARKVAGDPDAFRAPGALRMLVDQAEADFEEALAAARR